ncbi:MAG TPA: wax ester/triacylglycerol synthase family O-acyltransferase [Acidimicrobiales bacterium]|jgi:diacylglycerol O-acyltransferase / wax synthase|nr:wax ester/triacylglycerol synthase family O-acyltransferase [Acidimicrobiales bacterium]
MKQLSGLDASFLHMETPNQFGHVSSVSIYEPPDGHYRPFESWRAQVERRLHLLEPLTRRLVEVPFGLDHPFWIEDPHFDLDFHVRHSAVPPPGDERQLADLVGRIIGRPLDRTRPLWESYVIEGLDGGRFAILTKVHHSTIDGASGAELLTMMLDRTPSPDGDEIPLPVEEIRRPERVPADTEVLARALLSMARKPGRMLLLSARTMRDVGRATRNPLLQAAGTQLRSSLRGPLGTVLNLGRPRPEERDDAPLQLPSLNAPKTPFNAAISPHRKFAFRSTSLDAVKSIKNALGATVNDVVMAACAGGLRTYLEKRGELPDQPLVSMIPVSVRTGEETEKWTNRVSAIFANLPTNEPEPLERVRKVHEAMMVGKGLHDALPAEALTEFAQFPPPAVFARASRLATRLELGNRFRLPVNLVISNVPGPREPLYSAGARLLHYYPVSTIVDGQGLNVTVQSYLDTLDFGLVACSKLMPDLWDLLDAMVAELQVLADAAGVDVPIVLERDPA